MASTRPKDVLGRFGEDLAVRRLQDAGMVVLARNWRFRQEGLVGELDVVARDGSELVVVEVKTRSGTRFGTPVEAITREKARRLRLLAARWLATAAPERPEVARITSLRIDVMSVLLRSGRLEVEHLRGVL